MGIPIGFFLCLIFNKNQTNSINQFSKNEKSDTS